MGKIAKENGVSVNTIKKIVEEIERGDNPPRGIVDLQRRVRKAYVNTKGIKAEDLSLPLVLDVLRELKKEGVISTRVSLGHTKKAPKRPEKATKPARTKKTFAEKLAERPGVEESFDLQEKVVPDMYESRHDRARQGSLRAAVDLKCLDCSAWKRDDVRNCPVTSCPLWPFRPFQVTVNQTKGKGS